MPHRLRNLRSWVALVLAVLVAIPSFTGVAPQIARAVAPIENPVFTIDTAATDFRLKITFTPNGNVPYYLVRLYTSSDNYNNVRQFIWITYSGEEFGTGSSLSTCQGDALCMAIGSGYGMKFTIQAVNGDYVGITNESPKSLAHFATRDPNPTSTSPANTANDVFRINFQPRTGQSSMSVRLYRSDDYSQLYREVSGITTPTKDIEVPGDYSYKYKYRFTGSTINNVVYLSTAWLDSGYTTYVRVIPNPPANVRLTGGNASFTVSWDTPEPRPGAVSTLFKVEFSEDKSFWISGDVSAPATSATVGYLTNGTPYWVRVTHYSSTYALSTWSSSTPVIPSYIPSIPALTLKAADERIDASWVAPADGGAPILNYLLQYSTDGSNWTDITVDPTKRSHSITGLVNGTQYTVRIYARNNSGLSATNQLAITATPVGTAIPRMTAVSKIDTTRATLSMTVDTKGNTLTPYIESGAIGSYDAPYTGAPAKGTNVSVTQELTGLTPGYWYLVRPGVLIGSNRSFGTAFSFTTTPNAPTGLSATMTGTTAAVSWNDSPVNNGAYIKYQVWAEQNGVEAGNRCTTFTGGGINCSITGLTPGKNYVIKATAQATGANYGNGTSVPANLNVTTLAPQVISFSFATLPKKSILLSALEFDVSPYATVSSGLLPTFTSLTTGKCSVVGKTVYLASAGTCTIRASQSGNSKYAAATNVDASFVIATSQSITFSINSIGTQTLGGSTLNLAPLATASSGLTVSFSSATPSICTVSDSTLTYVGAGKCRVLASQDGSDAYDPALNVAREITVNRGTQSTLTVTSTTGTYGTELVLTTSGGSGSGIVSYAIDTNSVSATATGCAITSDGLVSTSAGKCAVIVTKADDVNYLSKTSLSTLITLQKASQTIAFVPIAGSGALLQGGSVIATATASSALTVTVTSDTTSKCTVSGTTVSLVSDGTCTLRGTQSGNSNYNAATAATTSFEISPKPIPETSPIDYVRLTSPSTYRVGDAVALSIPPAMYQGSVVPGTFEFIPTIPGSLSFGPVTVDSEGVTRATAYFAKSNQAFNLYAVFTPTDSVNFAQGQTFAAITVNARLQNIVVNSDLSEYNQTRAITFTGIASTGQVTIDLSPTDSQGQAVNIQDQQAHCTINKQTVTRDNPGRCYVRVGAMGDGVYESSLGIGEFVFTRLSQSIVMTNTDQLDSLTAENIGDTVDLSVIAGASSALTVTASSLTTSVCTMSGLTLTVVAAGKCEINIQQAGDDTYLPITTYVYAFNILRLEQASLALTSTSTTFGAPLTLTASGGSGTGQYSFTSVDGLATGCTVVNGTLVSTSSGSCLVSVTKAGDGAYLPKSTTPLLVEINRATQTIQASVSTIQTVSIGSAPIDLAPYIATSSGSSVTLRANDERICSVTGSVLTVYELGICTLTASQDGTDNHEPAVDVVVTLNVNPVPAPVPQQDAATETTTTTIAKVQQTGPSVPSSVSKSRTLKFTMKTASGTPLTVSASGACKVAKVTKIVSTKVKVKGKTVIKKTTVQTGWLLSFTKRGTCRATFKSPGNASLMSLAKTVKITVK